MTKETLIHNIKLNANKPLTGFAEKLVEAAKKVEASQTSK